MLSHIVAANCQRIVHIQNLDIKIFLWEILNHHLAKTTTASVKDSMEMGLYAVRMCWTILTSALSE